MNITLSSKRVISLKLNEVQENEIDQKSNVRLTIGTEVFLNTNDKNLARVRYPIEFTIKNTVKINLEYDFDFISDEEIQPDFLSSMVLRTKMPSLAFPYIKIYLENLMSASGYMDIQIPFLDFMENPLQLDAKDD